MESKKKQNRQQHNNGNSIQSSNTQNGGTHKKPYSFENRKAYNDLPLKPGEVLVPMVVDREMRITLTPMGFNPENMEMWKIGRPIPVAFYAVPAEQFPLCMKVFYSKVREFQDTAERPEEQRLQIPKRHYRNGRLQLSKQNPPAVYSLDALPDREKDEHCTAEALQDLVSMERQTVMETPLNRLLVEEFLRELEEIRQGYGAIVEAIMKGYRKGEIIQAPEIPGGRANGYYYVNRVLKTALQRYMEET